MTASDQTRHGPPDSSPRPAPPPAPLPGDMMASAEMQAWIARLEAEKRSVGVCNRYLAVVLAAGLVLLSLVFFGVYRWTVGSYARLDEVTINRHPANQGRLDFSFQVTAPGKVHYRRASGDIETEVIDSFHAPGQVSRAWAWVYEPGEEVEVSLTYRSGWFRRTQRRRFPTSNQADLVILIDTTGSMTPFIAELKEKCASFSRQLEKQALRHRFALIGFGDTNEAAWIDRHDFTADVAAFREAVGRVERFDGGDPAESALDALEEALALPFDQNAIRRFFLVTDASCHEPSRSGQSAESLAARLKKHRVLLHVFSKRQHEEAYGKLLGPSGKFDQIERFGQMLAEGRVLED